MRKVLTDRKLLERLQERLDPHRDAVDWGMLCDTLRIQLASTGGEAVDGVDFGFDDRSVRVSQEAYSIFMDRESWMRKTIQELQAQLQAMQPGLAGLVVPKELLALAVSLPSKESDEANRAGIVARGEAQAAIRALLNQAGGE